MVKGELRKGTIFLAFLVALYFLAVPCVHGTAISPPNIDNGTSPVDSPELKVSFNVSSYGRENQAVSFRTVTDNLISRVTFKPEQVYLDSSEYMAEFEVKVNLVGLPGGTYMLVIAADPEIIGAEPNRSYDSSVTGIILPASTATVYFQVPPSNPTTKQEPEKAGAGAAPELPKNLNITVPQYVRMPYPNTAVSIKIKNTGKVGLHNLTLDIGTDQPLVFTYDKFIGDLDMSEEKTLWFDIRDIGYGLSNIYVTVSDQKKKWQAAFPLYRINVTETKDCLRIEPKRQIIPNETDVPMDIKLINICNVTLTNVGVSIPHLNYSASVPSMEESFQITPKANLKEGIYEFSVLLSHSNGNSTDKLKIIAIDYYGLLEQRNKIARFLSEMRLNLSRQTLIYNFGEAYGGLDQIEGSISLLDYNLREGNVSGFGSVITDVTKKIELVYGWYLTTIFINQALLAALLVIVLLIIIWLIRRWYEKWREERFLKKYKALKREYAGRNPGKGEDGDKDKKGEAEENPEQSNKPYPRERMQSEI